MIALLCSMNVSRVCADTPFWQKDEFSQFCAKLDSPTPQMLNQILGEFVDTTRQDVNSKFDKIRLVTFDKVKPKLEQAQQNRMSIMQLFTLKEYADDDNCILLYDQDTLRRISNNYNLHGVWMTKAPITDSNNKYLLMKFLLIGHGKLIIGYPENREVKVKDYSVEYKFIGSAKFDYKKYISMDIVHDGKDISLKNIRTLESPTHPQDDFTGPFKTTIDSLSLESTKVRARVHNTIDYFNTTLSFKNKPIDKKTP